MQIQRKTDLIQKFYLREILTGLFITLKNLFFGKKVTIQYPEQRRQYSNRFRGLHYIKAVNGVENCTACMLCPTVCPANCIHIEAGERDDKEKYPVRFEIDILRCCFCGMCEEACPKDAIKLSNIGEMTQAQRVVYDKQMLMEQRGSKL
ncbi:MAG: NADH-quinone oxidoreductase subunit NuoI [Bdellovibrionaceae bacterium]|nr:NADH-quinone oxidoreductase subunit NuoI [Pseudobdellovibrionaceae bacterium]|tara:strand:+ start:97 stop:543 length:447 start_codon:yes stop_codon:yes gene_type:complete